MTGVDDGYNPRPEKKNTVFGQGTEDDPYFEQDGDAAVDSGLTGSAPDFEPARQLDLGEEDARLPWLEGDDEDHEDEKSGMGQSTMLVIAGLAALAVIVGSVFWALRGREDAPLVADGGVIAAPKEPYKVKPDNPGGEVVAGTGDTSFAVAEGQSRAPQIDGRPVDDGDDAAKAKAPSPGFEAMTPASRALPKPGAAPAASAAPAGGAGVQVGAYSSREAAEAGWTALKSQYAPLAAVSHRVVQGKADIGTVYRLQAVPGDAAAARTLCSGMKGAGLSCQVKN